jgi:pyruvate/2-oxoglutarate/acetoin dehydrogenase E1 component
MHQITYAQAINEALIQKMVADESVILIGQGVKSPWYVGNTAAGLIDRFGEERVIDTPVSEGGISGVAVGAALAGLRPVLLFPRMDFMYYAMDQIVNHAANWYYMFGGQRCIPLTIWGIINRGGEQAAQHSQALQAVFAHIPGLKVVMPSTPYDAKGLLISSIEDNNPVVFIDERWLYQEIGDVPENIYAVPLGKARMRREGKDISIFATSYLANEALKSAETLSTEGISAEIIDLRSIKPLDEETLFTSVKKTGRVLVIDGGWRTCGLAADISARLSEQCFKYLKVPVKRLTLPDAPAPASYSLEKHYYITEVKITAMVKHILKS